VSTNRLPSTLVEAIRYFSDEQVCIDFVAGLRWADGIAVCPRCESQDNAWLATRRVWKCRTCKKQFSVKVGTIFEDSPIKLKNWLAAIWLIANSKNGISSHELGRAIGLTQKSAWFVNHRIRLAMRTGSFQKFDGEVETDETYIGGIAYNMHRTKRIKLDNSNRPHLNKAMVVGTVQRGTEDTVSKVHAEPMLDTLWDSERAHVRRTVEPGADLYTDAAPVYSKLRTEYKHSTVNHRDGEYARGRVSTNSIENFWALLKRALHGTYVAVDEAHLWRYVDERVFAFNLRDMTDLERFQTVLKRAAGRRLTYAELTAN
jgi:transposase-like protein